MSQVGGDDTDEIGMLQQHATRWIVWDRTWGDLREEGEDDAGRTLWHRDAGSAPGGADGHPPGSGTYGTDGVTSHALHPGPAEPPDRPGGHLRSGGEPATLTQSRPRRPQEQEPATGNTEHAGLVHQVIDDRAVDIVFQPIVNVRTDRIVGYEALSRGPAGSPLEAPGQLFSAAQAVGRAGELDWICRAEAFRRMLEHRIPQGLSLFVNVGADSLLTECPEDLLPIVWQTSSELRIFIEISGDVLSRRPRQVLETVRRARAAGWGLSIGETEFSAGGLAMLPVLEPDVVKIDQRLIADSRAYAGRAMWAALGEVEHTGATLLVENVEDHDAMMLGSMVGGYHQRGFHHGRPGPLPDVLPTPSTPIQINRLEAADALTPFEMAVKAKAHVCDNLAWADVNRLMLALVGPLSQADVPPVAAFLVPEEHLDSQDVGLIYRSLLARCPLVVVIGPDTSRYGAWRVRDAHMSAGHPLLQHGFLVALSPVSSLTVAGRRRTDGTWDVAISDHRNLARQIMRRTMGLLDTLEGGVRHP